MLSFLKRLALPAALIFATQALADGGIHITDPYARFVQGNGVVYFRIDNHTDQPDRLISAQTDIGMVMLMINETDANGMLKMKTMPEGFPVDPMGSRTLQPAGDHVMLMGLSAEPEQGQTFTLTLTFEKAGKVTLTVPVDNTRRSPPGLEPTPYDVTSGD